MGTRAAGAVVVVGLTNVETNVAIETFPIEQQPVMPARIDVGVSGVGYNVATALSTLRNDVQLITPVADDLLSREIKLSIEDADWTALPYSGKSPRSAVLYSSDGERMVFNDTGDALSNVFDVKDASKSLDRARVAVLSTSHLSRLFLPEVLERGVDVAVDLQTDSSPNSSMAFVAAHARIIFASGDGIAQPEEWLRATRRYGPCDVAVVGLGAGGALLAMRGADDIVHVPAMAPFGVRSTVGAGDALFAGFLQYFYAGLSEPDALSRATIFAGAAIGTVGGSAGFLTEAQVEVLQRDLAAAK